MAISDAAWATIEALNEKIRAQAEEIERLKAHTMRLESSLRASEELYVQQAKKLAQAEADKERPYAEIRVLNRQVLQQMDTIERLRKRGVTREEVYAIWQRHGLGGITDLLLSPKGLLIEDNAQSVQEPQRKPTRAEVEDDLWELIDDKWDMDTSAASISVWVADYLVSKGMVEDAPKPIQHWRDGGKACDIEQPTKDDPLKVGLSPIWNIQQQTGQSSKVVDAFVELTKAHNALLDEVRQIQRTINGPSVLETRLSTLEQRPNPPTEQRVWPKVPETGHTAFGWQFLHEELARIRVALRVKEVE